MTWSTWERTRSQVSSGVRRLVCKSRRKRLESSLEDGGADGSRQGHGQTHHIDLSVGVAHVAHDAAVLHPIQMFSGHHVLVSCREGTGEPKAVEISSDFSFPALGSEKLSLGQHQMNFHQDETPPGCDNRYTWDERLSLVP